MKPLTYKAEHLSWMQDNCSLTRAAFHAAFQDYFKISVSFKGLAQKRLQLGFRIVRDRYPSIGREWPIGTELIRRGHWFRKVSDKTAAKRKNWKLLHRIKWEELNGPIPDGMLLFSKGDVLNADPSNWSLVSLSMLPDLNGKGGAVQYKFAPDELQPAIMGLAKLRDALRQVNKVGSHGHPQGFL